MGLASGQIGEDEFFARTPEFEPLEGLRNPESDTKTSLGASSLGWPLRIRDIYARGTSRGLRDVSHDDQGQAGASGRRAPVASLVLKEHA